MQKTVFLFSGQGSQYTGMGLDFVDIKEVRKIFDIGSKIVGWNIIEAIEKKSKEELSDTLISQPSIFAVSLAALIAIQKEGIHADAVAGHSLGEYAAMVAAGILTVEEGFRAIKIRAEAMAKGAKNNPGGMAAVLGMCNKEIKKICDSISADGDYVTPVNYNSKQQTVIAGTEKGINKAVQTLKEHGAKRVLKLSVSAAFHSELMRDSAAEVESAFKSLSFINPQIDFYSNVTGAKLEDFSDMPNYLGKHIFSPVLFVDEITALADNGFNVFLELGPDKILTGLVKKTVDNVIALNVENKETLLNVKEQLLC